MNEDPQSSNNQEPLRTLDEARVIVAAANIPSLSKLVEFFADAPPEVEISGKVPHVKGGL